MSETSESSEVKQFEFTVPEGTVTVSVMEATLSERRREAARTPALPRLRVKGTVRIRGREYTIHTINARYLGAIRDRHGRSLRWDRRESPYQGGFRRANGTQLDWETKAYDRLWDIEVAALDAYDAANPGWETESRGLALHYERDRLVYQVRPPGH